MNVNRPAFSFYQPYQAPAVPAPPVPQYYQQPQQPQYQQPYQPPQYQQVPVRTFQWNQPPQQAPVPVVQQQQQRPQQIMTQVPYGYGWVNDPLQYSLYSTPPLIRPQMPGETFVERVVKNTGLAMFESFLVSMLLAVRQMVWEPEQRVIDVTPQQAQQMPIPQPPPKGS
jgi:hypothetical protein